MVRVLITGAAGFIGSNLIRRMQDEFQIVGLDDLSTGSRKNIEGLRLRFIEGSILDHDCLRHAIAGCDAVVHLAAVPSVPRSLSDPARSHLVNATGTLMVLEAAREIGDVFVVVASSSSVYGANPILPKHEDLCPMPLSPYAVSKLATEQYALAWQHSFGLKTVAFRFFNVFGPGQPAGHAYAAVVPAFINAGIHRNPVRIFGDGLQSRDFTYVGTVTEILQRAVRDRVANTMPVNLAFGTRTTLLELASIVESELGYQIEKTFEKSRLGDVRHSQADDSRLRDLFPSVKPFDLQEGIRETIRWMKTA